ncbi:MAG: hypothetical protein KDD03_11595 [Gelidibacter sp.]|nr:hypothetical protein [Gelidibacter sp.]
MDAASDILDENTDAQDKNAKKGRTLADVMKDLAEANKELQNSTKKEASAILDRIDKLNKEKEAWERLTKAKKENEKVIELIGEYGSRDFIQAQISGFQDQLNATSKLNSEYNKIAENLKKMQDWYDRLYGTKKRDIKQTEEQTDAMAAFIAKMKEWASIQEELLSKQEDLLGGFRDDFFSGTGFDFTGRFIEGFEKMKDVLNTSEESWAAWGASIMEIGQEAFNFINQQQQAQFDAQYDRLEQDKEIAIAFAGESVSAKEEIERQYEEKRKRIQREQAKAQKQTALFNASIDIAQGILATIGEMGFPAAIPLIAAIGVIGAAQIAMISSQQIPQYWNGRDGGGAEFALVDEVRPEVHTDKHGNVKSFGSKLGSNIRFLDEGDKIFSSREKWFNEELGGLLNDNGIAYDKTMNIGQTMLIDNGGLQKEDFVRHIKSLENTIRSKENINITVDKRGTNVVRGNTELLNNKIKLKGRTV